MIHHLAGCHGPLRDGQSYCPNSSGSKHQLRRAWQWLLQRHYHSTTSWKVKSCAESETVKPLHGPQHIAHWRFLRLNPSTWWCLTNQTFLILDSRLYMTSLQSTFLPSTSLHPHGWVSHFGQNIWASSIHTLGPKQQSSQCVRISRRGDVMSTSCDRWRALDPIRSNNEYSHCLIILSVLRSRSDHSLN